MSEENNISQTEIEPLFENEFVVVTTGGEVVLKKTSLFDERILTTVDPESAETQIKAFESAFENLTARVDGFFRDWENQQEIDKEEAQKAFNDLKNDIVTADAIGDFEQLIKDADNRFEKLMETTSDEAPAADDDDKTNSVETSSEETSETIDIDTEAAENEKSDVPKEEEKELSETETYYKDLAEKAEQLMELTDWAYVSMEFDNIDNLWGEGPDPEEVDIKPYREKIDQLREQFEQKKQAHYEEKKRQRQENLEKKETILEKLKVIVDEKKWSATKEVGKLKGEWEHIKAVPSDVEEEMEEKFKNLLSTFDDHKVDRLVRKKQQEEDNLTGKLVILEKMEEFVEKLDDTVDWTEMDKDFERLSKQFRKIGRVPVEKNQEIWSRYHSLQDSFHSMRFKHDKKYRNKIEKYLTRKKKLIDEAEALIDANDLAQAARDVNKLHRRWKKAGNLPQKEENELWDRFKAATDAFNQKKSDNIDSLRHQEQENLEKKYKLIEKAEELKDSDNWEQTHKDLQNLMKQWKKIGPVPRRSTGKIWKKFKSAMDHFYDRRRDHFKEVKEERKDNLKEKEEVLDKLRELQNHEDPIEAVNQAKPLQEEFKKAGYVPIKHKNRMWKEYRQVCDVIYDRFRAAKAAEKVVGRENVEDYSADDIADIRKLNGKASSLRKQIDKMNQDLIQKKESLSYFKPSGGSSPLLDDVKEKIKKTEEEVEEKENQLAELEKKIDLIKKEGD